MTQARPRDGGAGVGSKNGLAEHIGDKAAALPLRQLRAGGAGGGLSSRACSSSAELDLLVTSREPLHVTGEQEYPVPPFVHEEGGRLLPRAGAGGRPDFGGDEASPTSVAGLDDLPLALELAAARVSALSAAQILERLEQRLPLLTGGARDLPERQRTLRATIEWRTSCSSRGAATLRPPRFFRGGSTSETAEEVAEADLDTLQSLVDKSLVRRSEERYWMLDTIREFATEKLEESGEDEELRRSHAEHFFAFARGAESHLRSDEIEWVDRLDSDRDNLRAALDRFAASGESQRPCSWRRRFALLVLDRPVARRASAPRGGAICRQHTDGRTRQRVEPSSNDGSAQW